MGKRPCCGHHCPVCGGSALPLQGFPTYGPNRGQEGDVSWRVKLGRIAHKCQDAKHRFDVDVNTGKPLPDYLYKLKTGDAIKTVPAGAPRA